MKISNLPDLLKKQFPDAEIQEPILDLTIGSFPEWDSLGHFNLLLLVEESYSVRFSMEEMSEIKSFKDITKVLSSRGVEP
jgi:acyl carrier protein